MHVSFKFKIYRTPDIVWRYLNQPANNTKWMYGFVSYRLLNETNLSPLAEYEFNDGRSKTKILQQIAKSQNKDFIHLQLESESQIHHVKITMCKSGENATKVNVIYSTHYKSYLRNLFKYFRYRSLQKKHNDNLLRLKQCIEFDAA